jgi:hypothetical protein
MALAGWGGVPPPVGGLVQHIVFNHVWGFSFRHDLGRICHKGFRRNSFHPVENNNTAKNPVQNWCVQANDICKQPEKQMVMRDI